MGVKGASMVNYIAGRALIFNLFLGIRFVFIYHPYIHCNVIDEKPIRVLENIPLSLRCILGVMLDDTLGLG